MKHLIGLILLSGITATAGAQRILNLDSCRAMALRNNKQMAVADVKRDMARNMKKSARTKYLPHVNAMGGYVYSSREISLLSNDQKTAFSNIGTTASSGIGGTMQSIGAGLTDAQKMAIAQQLGALGTTADDVANSLNNHLNNVASGLNAQGQRIVDAFRTDNRNMFAGSIMVTQPIYMGGSIMAMNRMADIGEKMAQNSGDAMRQATIYDADKAYWTVVSLKHKKRLAESYLSLIRQLSADVAKMVKEGVATRSEGLSVDVKVNEAEMTLAQVEDGLVLARMLLCQICGLPLDENLILADEDIDNIAVVMTEKVDASVETAVENRPELRLLQNTIDLSRQATNLLKAGNLPKVALFGGYSITNPNVFDGYHNKFGDVWNVGVLLCVPVWNWGDVAYKVRAAKNATTIAALEFDEAREKVELQVTQSSFKVNEAGRRLTMANANIRRAEENLRCANLGFKEGVIQATTVMEAQTAWLQARSQKIDAEIDVKLSQVNLEKALGTLQ